MSLLALTSAGWVQILNFVLTGVLVIVFARALRSTMAGTRGGAWGPRLLAIMGVGLVVAGAFVTDGGAGYPAGAPSGAPDISWHGALHEVGFVMAMLSWTIATFVFRSHYANVGAKRLARLSLASVVAVFAVSVIPHADSFVARTAVATFVQFAFIAMVAVHSLRRISIT